MEQSHTIIASKYAAPTFKMTDLIEECGDSLYRFCRSLTYSKEDADDLFQETFLRALEQLPRISNADNPKSFLFSIASYIWKSWKRKCARRERLAPMSPLESLTETATNNDSVEDNLIAQEEDRIIRELVGTLPDKYKIPIIMYYSTEMNCQEIARTMKISVGTVKSRLFKARKLVEKGLVQFNEG